ncbi:MAG: cardiolipin synthase B [Deltaproteobacteria bacterium]|nr:cardiolipin synthase B [Deltaproteobacteria bacterium]
MSNKHCSREKESCCRHRSLKDGEPACECIPRLTEGQENFILFTEGDELYESMLSSIASAERSIRLESYILADDEVGRRFAEALVERARAGIEVRVLVDAAGSLFWGSGSFGRTLRNKGLRVRYFHSWSWRAPLRYNRRDHRKLLVVDEKVLYLGGFNIHRESSRSFFGENRWRDTHVSIYDGLAADGAEMFDAFWQGKLGLLPKHKSSISALIPNNTRVCRHPLHCFYTDRFRRATRFVFLTTPYFVPDHRTIQALVAASRRGVDCRLLVPRKSDVWLTQWAARAAYANLLSAGVRIYEYLPRMLHAKTALVDGSWATVGTANMDYRSFFTNYELNLVTRSFDLCRQLHDQFKKDMSESEEISPSRWMRRHWSHHFTETVGWLARRWL